MNIYIFVFQVKREQRFASFWAGLILILRSYLEFKFFFKRNLFIVREEVIFFLSLFFHKRKASFLFLSNSKE